MTLDSALEQLPPRPAAAWREVVRFTLVFLVCSLVFYHLRGLRLEGGDTDSILDYRRSIYRSPVFYYNLREAWTSALMQMSYWVYPSLPAVFSFWAAIFGGLYIAMLTHFSRDWRFLAPQIISINLWNFAGHIELYAPMLFLFTLYLILLRKCCTRRQGELPQRGLIACAAAFGVAYLFHKLMIIFSLSLLALVLHRSGGKWRWRHWPRRQVEIGLALILGAVLLDTGITLTMYLAERGVVDFMSDKIYELITPPTQAWADWVSRHSETGVFFWYTLGRPLHWRYYLGFLVSAAPLTLYLLHISRGRVLWERDWGVLFAAAIGLIWMFFWHPHMAWPDWDLFCMGAVPLNVLAGCLWTRRAPNL